MKKSKKKIHLSKILIYIFLIILAFIYLAPLAWMLLVSLKDNAEIFTSPFALPQNPQWGNYTFAWTAGYLGKATLNSAIIIAIIPTIIVYCCFSNQIVDGLTAGAVKG